MKGSDKKFNTEFEEAWQNAFEDAEAAPPPHVWENLQGKMAHADSLRYKNYYLIYRSLTVAASMLAAAFIVLYYVEKQDIAQSVPPTPTTVFSPDIATLSEQEEGQRRVGGTGQDSVFAANKNIGESTDLTVVNTGRASLSSPQNNEGKATNHLSPNQSRRIVSAADQQQIATTQSHANRTNLPVENTQQQIVAKSPNQTTLASNSPPDQQKAASAVAIPAAPNSLIDLELDKKFVAIVGPFSVAPMLELKEIGQENALEQNKKAYSVLPETTQPVILAAKEAKRKRSPKMAPEKTLYDQQGKLFANLNLGSAIFRPNFASNGSSVVNITGLDPDQVTRIQSATKLGEKHTPAASVTYGIRMGMRLSRRVILEGGVSYASYNTTSKTDMVWSNNGHATPITLQNNPRQFPPYQGQAYLAVDKEYKLNNSFEFASVPVQTGYVFGLGKHLNWVWKAGICTDIFMRNEISSDNQNLDGYTIQRSESVSPFRKMVFNGSVANEINYTLNQNYSFALEANYRFALNSFTQNDELFKSMPETYGLGMVIRYHFN
jgi:hypothetical protein